MTGIVVVLYRYMDFFKSPPKVVPKMSSRTQTFSLVQLSPLPPSLCQSSVNIHMQCVAGRGGVVLNHVGDHIL